MDGRTLLLILGFMLFLTGVIALVLTLVGLQLSFLTFIDAAGRTTGFVIRIVMIFGGVIIIYLTSTREDQRP